MHLRHRKYLRFKSASFVMAFLLRKTSWDKSAVAVSA